MDRNNREQILHIDRSKGFSLTDTLNSSRYPFFGSFADNFVLKEQNSRSKTLSEIDISQIEIKVVFDENRDGKTLAKEECNELLKKNLIELENEGYYHLDVSVAQALLSQQELIPKEWEDITNADEPAPYISGEIGYYGTTFVLKDDPTDEYVLAPFFNRGRWTVEGHKTKYFNREQLANMVGDPRVNCNLLTYAAVYKPGATMAV